MNTIDALQGTSEWLAARAGCFTASEAPAMMGASKYQTRSDLLKQKATGLTPDVDEGKQRLFDRGHAAEAAARPIVEGIIGETLYPVTGWIEVDGMRLLASFDGLTDIEDKAWESKLWNAALADAVRAAQLEPHYYWQLEQQLLVSGAENVYFTTSDGTPENTIGVWYTSYPERRAQLIAGWKQFAADLAEYQHVETVAAPVAATIEALPALFVQVEGKVLATNLDAFKLSAQKFIDGIKTELVNDQDFADADKMVKFLKDGEERLALAKQQALAQTASIDELFRTVDAISEQMKAKRLALDKLVKTEKDNRRTHIINDALMAFGDHLKALTHRIGGNWIPDSVAVKFRASTAEAVKGLKSLDSMRDKVATALAQAKIEANEIADRIELNRNAIKTATEDWSFLFPDFAQVCTKAADDFDAMLNQRIQQHEQRIESERQAAEAKTAAAVAAAVEADRMAEAKRGAKDALKEAIKGDVLQANLPPEEKRAAVVEHQDEIAAFMASREWGKDAGKVRAVLVEFVAFQAGRELAAAA